MTNPCAIRIRTPMSYEELEELLARHCTRPFDIAFDGMEDTDQAPRKIMNVRFETEQDRDAFRAALTRK